VDRHPVLAFEGCRFSPSGRACRPEHIVRRQFRFAFLALFAACLAGSCVTGTIRPSVAGEAIDPPGPAAASQNPAFCAHLPGTGSSGRCAMLDGPDALPAAPETRGAIHADPGAEGTAEEHLQSQKLARDLERARSKIARLEAETSGARVASERSVNRMNKELDWLRKQTGQLQSELADARRLIASLNAQAERTALERIDDKAGRRLAEHAAQGARDALERERVQSASATEQLESARIALKTAEATREGVIVALQQALDGQRETAAGLARSLDAARKENDRLKAQLRSMRAKQASRQQTGTVVARQPRANSTKAKANKSGETSTTAKATTIDLPNSLLPTGRWFRLFRE